MDQAKLAKLDADFNALKEKHNNDLRRLREFKERLETTILDDDSAFTFYYGEEEKIPDVEFSDLTEEEKIPEYLEIKQRESRTKILMSVDRQIYGILEILSVLNEVNTPQEKIMLLALDKLDISD